MFDIGKGDARRARRFLAKHGDEVAFELVDHKEADYSAKPGKDGLPPLADLEKLARFRRMLEQEQSQPHRLKDLAVDGNDLIGAGFAPGPQLGSTLRELLHLVVDDPSLNTREQLLERARSRRG
jgi:tRNA nucleotidyltransferase (CCA-adding enzyme)